MAKRNIVLAGIISMILCYAPVLFLTGDTMSSLTEEDGVYESLGALLFLLASIVFLLSFLKTHSRKLLFLLFALAFFFAAGEEISWGQRIFGFRTPPALEANNAQKEFSVHNLRFIQHEEGIGSSLKGVFLNFNRLFILFWVAYCIVIPIANKYSSKLSNLFSRIRLPIISIWFGVLFLSNEIGGKALELSRDACQDNCSRIYEIKEFLWALLVFLMAVYFLPRVTSQEVV